MLKRIMIRSAILAAIMLTQAFAVLAQGRLDQRPDSFVDVASVAPGLLVEARYAAAHNFVGAAIDGYHKPLCYLARPAAAALALVVQDLEPKGLTLKVYDCYRPARAVAHFVRWARDLGDQKMKAEFYPHVDKSTLFRDGYIAARSGHSRGSTADLTLARRADGQALDMGTPFDFFSPRSWPSDRSVSAEAQANRILLAQAMRKRGFRPYDKEWWHFTLRQEPYPQTYFDFPVR
ncbi:MAG: M15 family metallopeptidase [Alphaproteobacteria bacterium]|nr:M15 family metallopeptidase [Alphaproteobacteria bacterium]